MDQLRRARDAGVEALVASVAVGAVEATRIVVLGDGSVASWAVLAMLASAGAAGIALAVAVVLAGLARVPAVARWRAAIAAGGAERVIAAMRAALLALAVAGAAVAFYEVVAWSHATYRFREPALVGLFVAAILAPIAAAIALAALAVERRLAVTIRGGRGATLLDGRRLYGAGLAAALAVGLGPALALALAAPAAGLASALTLPLAIVAVAAARGLALGRRRVAWIAAALALVAIAVGPFALRRAEEARGLVVAHGFLGARVARTAWALADGDGDRYAPASAGGADCDDADPRRSPAAIEIPGNGVDENCTGADEPLPLAGPRVATRPAAAVGTRPNVLLVSVDTLRPDHLGAWGYHRRTSPALDALAATAVRFAWAVTSCPWTRCSIPALLTGRFTSTVSRGPGIAPPPTLAGVLRGAGWDTAAITCCERFTIGEELLGFATNDASADAVRMRRVGQSNGDAVADAALRWLAARPADGPPFFLWTHFYDPHHPYAAPEGATAFGDSEVDRYDAEIAYVDRHIGRVLAALDAGGLGARTIVVVVADHGEEFGEHGIRFHARSLHDEVVRIPLVIRAPGARAAVVDTPVSLVDVMPTILELAGVEGPAGMNGVSLAAALRGRAAPARPILVELVPVSGHITRDLVAVFQGSRKIVWDREANAWSRDDAGMKDLLRRTIDRELARLPTP